MNQKEFVFFASALKTYYPKDGLLPNNQAMELWFRQLQDIPYNVAEAALNKWVATNKWSPTIADIREMSTAVANGETPDWGEGWEQVLAAIRKFGMYRIGEAMESLDGITRQCVERLGFENICKSENIISDRAQFRAMYEQLADRDKKNNQISDGLKITMQNIRDGIAQREQDALPDRNS